MSPIAVLITIAVYFICLFSISYIAGRKADNEGFFVGNRQILYVLQGMGFHMHYSVSLSDPLNRYVLAD